MKKECSKCKEGKHYSLGMCRKCYKRYKKSISPIIECSSCNENKKLYLKNMCKTCYEKISRSRRNNLGTCKNCKQRRVIIEGLCKKCKNGDFNIINCVSCHKDKIMFAKNMCKVCYNKVWGSSRVPRKCDKCNRIKIINSVANNIELCHSCYLSCNKKICFECNQLKTINKIVGNKSFCGDCAGKYRLQKCNICNKDKPIADSNKHICYDCYYKEYRSRPEVIAKKYEHMANRKKLYELGNFSAKDWLCMMNEYKWLCFYCSKKLIVGNRTLDHIIPISKGGKHTKNNLIPCCVSCNSKKHNINPLIWIHKIKLIEDKSNYIINLISKMED